METLPTFVVNGGAKLPTGFRFCPTDEELIVHYLKKMVLGVPLPASVIPVLDVFQTDPWNLPGVGGADTMGKGYFFSEKKDLYYDGIIVIADGTGFWKPIENEIPIVYARTNRVIGTRKTLVFCGGDYSGDGDEHTETQWFMHEIRLIPPVVNGTTPFPAELLVRWTKLAVYRVFKESNDENKKKKPKRKRTKKQSKKKKAEKPKGEMPSFIDFATDGNDSDEAPQPPPPSPSVSEEVTSPLTN